jgi:hypothetical protein
MRPIMSIEIIAPNHFIIFYFSAGLVTKIRGTTLRHMKHRLNGNNFLSTFWQKFTQNLF